MKQTDKHWELSDTDAELVSQYIDGELPASESRVLEARLHEDAELRLAMVKMQECNNLVRDVLASSDSIPAAVTQLLDDRREPLNVHSADVLPFPSAPATSTTTQAPRWVYALAASVLAAVGAVSINNALQPSESRLPGNDAIVSAALDTVPSGYEWHTLEDGREFQGVLTFPHENGSWCREYLLRSQDADWRAVACLQGNAWSTQAAGLESYLETSNAYRPAGATDTAPVAVFISQHAAGIALDGSDEAALIASQWD
ncbi:MAG: hypothetical protein AAF749_13540 [Pseudomonadota bacterium]